jgi:transketolase
MEIKNMKTNNNELKELATTVRILSAAGVEKAKSGHPGLPLGAADFASLLWSDFLNFDPKKPDWANRDRFILSAGHGSMLVYSLLNLFGFDLPMSELQAFRQWESKTPGHPEYGVTAGIEATTGPLGQGSANAVGVALSGKLLAAEFGEELFNYKVYALVSDGDLMEGLSAEAGSLAGHLGLGNLVYIYDDNKVSLAANTDVCFSEDIQKKYESFGWFVQSCDGHDFDQLRTCLEKAKAEKSRPSIICARTIIGCGSPNKANDCEVHGAPLGAEEFEATKKNLGWTHTENFYVPENVAKLCQQRIALKQAEHAKWQETFSSWAQKNTAAAQKLNSILNKDIPAALFDALLAEFKEPKKEATRSSSGRAIQVIAKHLPNFVGGSADLDPSTKTNIKGSGDISKENFVGRNIHFGVREHAMGSIANGLAYQQCWFPYTATFLVFSDYMRPTIRLAALSHLQTLFIFTHDSYAVGEDGPTHEPVEQVASLRLIPNNRVYRPADGLETAMSYYSALAHKHGPSTLIFTRQDLAPLEREASATTENILKGGYVLSGSDCVDLVLVATGSEVALAQESAKLLAQKGKKARVVSLPCVELFLSQDKKYQEQVIPPNAKKVSLEAGVTCGWERIVGSAGLCIGLDHYGASAPASILAEKFGLTAKAVCEKIEAAF